MLQVPNLSRMSRGKHWLSLALLLSITFAIGACRHASTTEPEQTNFGPMVKTTIAGVTVDEAGMPLSGIAVSAHGQTAISNEHGYFVLPDILVPKERALVLAKQEGYFPSARAATATENGLTEVKLYMMPHGVRASVSAATGGTVNATGTSGTASVRFSANGMTVNGNAYTGEAKVAVRYLDPAEANFSNYFSGDEAAIRESGDNALLISYGVLRVDMRTPSGEMIQPAPGKPAEISYPVPANVTNLPESIPLWYFDETLGLWVEEGIATKQGDHYVGTVKHFTDWNCDVPAASQARITGKVLCNGRGVPGVVVRIGQVSAYTGKDGLFTRRVPAGVDFDVQVMLEQNDDLYSSDPITVPAISAGDERLVMIPLAGGCPATITGTLTNDNGTKIPGTVTWTRPNGKARSFTTVDGSFEMFVPPLSEVGLAVSSWACEVKKTFSAQAGETDSKTDIGSLVICSDKPTEGDLDLSTFGIQYTRAILSPDGQFVAIAGMAPVAIVRNAKTGQFVSSTPMASDSNGYVMSLEFSQDGSRYMIVGYGDRESKAVVAETSTGKILREVTNVYKASLFPDGTHVLVSMWDGNKMVLQKYSVESGVAEVIYDISGIPEYASLYGMSADGKKVLFRDNGSMFYIYDLIGKKKASQVTIPVGWEDSLTYSSDLSKLAYREHSTKNLVVVDLSSGTVLSAPNIRMNGHAEHSLAMHPNGKDILFQTPGAAYSIVLVDFSTGKVTRSLPVLKPSVLFNQMCISRIGNRASGTYVKDGKLMLRVWDLER